MTRPRMIDPEALAAEIPAGLSIRELRRRIAETIRMAVVASGGGVQIHRACEGCGVIMRLGGRKWDTGCDGYVTKRFCSHRCRMRLRRVKASGPNS